MENRVNLPHPAINNRMRPLQVLLVDDSAVVREVITAVLNQDRNITVTTAADPLIAIDKMRRARFDVILLDLEMPRMDGLTFLRKIMTEAPMPVVVCSTLIGPGTEAALRAMEEGAVEVVAKPRMGVRGFFEDAAVAFIETVRGAAQARIKPVRRIVPQLSTATRQSQTRSASPTASPAAATARRGLTVTTDKVIAVGASTGGTEALRELLEAMPIDAPGIVIVQHMPEVFTAAFANRLNGICRIEVKEAAHLDRVIEGRALIAPGNRHMTLVRSGGHYIVEVTGGPLVSRHRPSVDVLFNSVAKAAGQNAVGVMLTGMGDDGADGMLEMKRAGAATIAQDEASCVVFGMPKEAIARGGVDEVMPLSRIPGAMLRRAR